MSPVVGWVCVSIDIRVEAMGKSRSHRLLRWGRRGAGGNLYMS
jgi:hypothetical protein